MKKTPLDNIALQHTFLPVKQDKSILSYPHFPQPTLYKLCRIDYDRASEGISAKGRYRHLSVINCIPRSFNMSRVNTATLGVATFIVISLSLAILFNLWLSTGCKDGSGVITWSGKTCAIAQ